MFVVRRMGLIINSMLCQKKEKYNKSNSDGRGISTDRIPCANRTLNLKLWEITNYTFYLFPRTHLSSWSGNNLGLYHKLVSVLNQYWINKERPVCRSQHNMRHFTKPFLIIWSEFFDLVLIYEQEFKIAHIDQKHFMLIILSDALRFLYIFDGKL